MSKNTPEQQHWQDIGFYFAQGCIKAGIQAFLIIWIAMFVLRLIGSAIFPTDDSDASWWHRSGVEIVTDVKTGRQYLKTSQGFIVPREERK